MRLKGYQRVIRFLFLPITMLAVVCLLHYRQIYKEIDQLCTRRAQCLTGCIQNTFPALECNVKENIDLTYRGQFYDKLYFYPYSESESFQNCLGFADDIVSLPTKPNDPSVQLKVHTCFEPCRKPADCLTGFDEDHRPKCSPETRDSGLYCVHPDETCEHYVEKN